MTCKYKQTQTSIKEHFIHKNTQKGCIITIKTYTPLSVTHTHTHTHRHTDTHTHVYTPTNTHTLMAAISLQAKKCPDADEEGNIPQCTCSPERELAHCSFSAYRPEM